MKMLQIVCGEKLERGDPRPVTEPGDQGLYDDQGCGRQWSNRKRAPEPVALSIAIRCSWLRSKMITFT